VVCVVVVGWWVGFVLCVVGVWWVFCFWGGLLGCFGWVWCWGVWVGWLFCGWLVGCVWVGWVVLGVVGLLWLVFVLLCVVGGGGGWCLLVGVLGGMFELVCGCEGGFV
jgi:hypothetical protein